jgi:peptidoglycan L-alanyl-D-glutamate endopeptidase CwlK
MPKFSATSRSRLETCHPDLQRVFNEVIKYRDCSVLEGIRTVEMQAHYVATGRSQTMNSKHLKQADGYSHAVDGARYPILWDDHAGFALFAGFVLGVAQMLLEAGEISHMLRSGIDWDDDGNVKEHSFFDGPHFEIIGG